MQLSYNCAAAEHYYWPSTSLPWNTHWKVSTIVTSST